MKTFRIANILSMIVVGAAVLFVSDANAQSRREIERERQRQIERYERQRRSNVRTNRSPRLSNREVNSLLLQGYQYGLQAGRLDRSRGKYNASNVYRNTPTVPYSGDASSRIIFTGRAISKATRTVTTAE